MLPSAAITRIVGKLLCAKFFRYALFQSELFPCFFDFLISRTDTYVLEARDGWEMLIANDKL